MLNFSIYLLNMSELCLLELFCLFDRYVWMVYRLFMWYDFHRYCPGDSGLDQLFIFMDTVQVTLGYISCRWILSRWQWATSVVGFHGSCPGDTGLHQLSVNQNKRKQKNWVATTKVKGIGLESLKWGFMDEPFFSELVSLFTAFLVCCCIITTGVGFCCCFCLFF